MTERSPQLLRPPIVEVVCGVVFEPMAELDPFVLGVYWDQRRESFPNRSLQPAVADETIFSIGPFAMMRAVFVSSDSQFLLQIQHDRFFMNWRSIGAGYPRFSERHGEQGLLKRALDEYATFSAFTRARFGCAPNPLRIELTKVDVLQRDSHWSGLEDLARMIPATSVLAGVQTSEARDVNLRFLETSGSESALVHIATIMNGSSTQAVRLEARKTSLVAGDIASAFVRANSVLNDVFFRLLPDAEIRFGLQGET